MSQMEKKIQEEIRKQKQRLSVVSTMSPDKTGQNSKNESETSKVSSEKSKTASDLEKKPSEKRKTNSAMERSSDKMDRKLTSRQSNARISTSSKKRISKLSATLEEEDGPEKIG